MRHSFRIAVVYCVLFSACCSSPTVIAAQGTQADYRADYEGARTLEERTRNRVFRANIVPHWLNDEPRFWYRVQVGPDQFRFVLVDAEHGVRRAAFDHDRLANALNLATGKQRTGDSLPFRAVSFKDDGENEVLEFVSDGAGWSCNLNTYELTSKKSHSANETTIKVLPAIRRSRGSDEHTRVRFVNRTADDVKVFWVDSSLRRVAYGRIAAGEHRDQHTFAGHVWLIVDVNDEPIVVFEATAEHGMAIIDDNPDLRPRTEHTGGRSGNLRSLSPDGKWKARVRNDNVVLEDIRSGDTTPISFGGTADDPFVARFRWSPDSSRLVVVQERIGQGRQIHLIESSPAGQTQPKIHVVDYPKPGDRIPQARPRLFDVNLKRQIPVSEELFPNPWSVTELRWHPDSTGFTFVYNQRGHQVLRVVGVDGANGETRVVIDETAETFIDYANKQYVHHVNESNAIIWMSERDGWNHLYLYDAQTGEARNQITKGEWVVRGVDRVDHHAQQIWFHAGGIHADQDPYSVHYCRVNFDGTHLVVLTQGDGTHSVSWSPDQRFFCGSLVTRGHAGSDGTPPQFRWRTRL